MASNTETSVGEEKFVFAVDMISFFLNERHPNLLSDFLKSEIAQRADSYRTRVQNRFNENMKRMALAIDETQSVSVRRDFLELKDQNETAFKEYCRLHKVHNLSQAFNAGGFLMYCTRVVVLSCDLFSSGMGNIFRIAVELVVSAFPDNKDTCRLIWDRLDDAALKYADAAKSALSGESTSYLFWRDPADATSSETEESSNSSTINSESDSVAEIQNITSTSSGESFSTAVTKMNVTNKECTDYVQSEAKASSTAAENVGSEIVGASKSPSALVVPDFVISNIEDRIKTAFLETDDESAAKLPPARSPIKSCLGKRPSPRKGQSVHFRGTSLDKQSGSSDESETEIKKPKLNLPETSD